MSNTCIAYSYRDGGNNRVQAEIILEGELSSTHKLTLITGANMDITGEPAFIPGQIGLPDLQSGMVMNWAWDDEIDHPWHEIIAITDTDRPVTDAGFPRAEAIGDLMRRADWNHAWRPETRSAEALFDGAEALKSEGALLETTNGDDTGLYYQPGRHPLAVFVQRHPTDRDIFLLQVGDIPGVSRDIEDNLDTLSHRLINGDQVLECTGAIRTGQDAVRLMIEAAHASNGIEGEAFKVSRGELLNAGLGIRDHIRSLLGIAEPEISATTPGF